MNRGTKYEIRTDLGDLKMNENQTKPNNLIDTTDCLEAVGVFRGWKNFLFAIVILSLFLLQISFWLVNVGYVKTDADTKSDTPAAATKDTEQIGEVVKEASDETSKIGEAAKQVAVEPSKIEKAAKQVATEPNKPTETAPQQQESKFRLEITFKQLAWLIRFLNFVLIPAAALYCLTMLFSLKISLLGRLGGINHIARAFFLSLVMLVLLLPWQSFFSGIVVGAIYTPGELVRWYTVETTGGISGIIFYYLRFTGYWLLVLLLFIFSQLRSIRWAKAILRRLEII